MIVRTYRARSTASRCDDASVVSFANGAGANQAFADIDRRIA